MCFSATASFTASTVLAVTGIVSVNKTTDIRFIPLSLIPFVFSFQQFCEGMVWLSFDYHGMLPFRQTFGYMYLILAQSFWPMFFPFAIWLIEKHKPRRYLLAGTMIVGLVIGSYLGFQVSSFPVKIETIQKHMVYIPHGGPVKPFNNGVLYFLATAIPPFLSSMRGMIAFGFFILTSFSLSVLFFPDAVISVWCYFAAILSLIIYLIIRKPVYVV
jgi:hypothetical protein